MAPVPTACFPDADDFWIVNVRLPLALLDRTVAHRDVIAPLAASPFLESLVAADIHIQNGRLSAIAPLGTASANAAAVVDGRQGLLFPCFVDLHTHLDKTQTWNRTPNLRGTFEDALAAVRTDAPRWSAADLHRRMEFGLRCSYAHGTKAMRTHFDAFDDMAATAIAVIQQLQADWRDRITLQAVCLVSLDYFLTPAGERLADLVAEAGAILGGVAYQNPDLDKQLDRLFSLAAERQLSIDLHVDETLDPTSQCLRQAAKAKLRHQFSHTVVCGHCCVLSMQAAAEVEETLRWVKEAEIGIVSLPMCNLYLQDRHLDRTPRYRGVTVLQELKTNQIPVAVASDNCRDPFYAYGDYDGREVLAQAIRIGQLDRPIDDWMRMVTWTPADLMGLPDVGRVGIGQPADLVLFKARTFNELLARPQSDRVVLRQGRAINTALPDYGELDGLLGIY